VRCPGREECLELGGDGEPALASRVPVGLRPGEGSFHEDPAVTAQSKKGPLLSGIAPAS